MTVGNKFRVTATSGDVMTDGKLAIGGAAPVSTTKELYVNGDIHATETLEVGGATTLSGTLDVTGNTEMTGLLSVGGTHTDTNKELYVNGDIEATATLEVGGTTTLTGKATLADDIEMIKQSAALTHTGASGGTSGLTIKSTHGFVDVESVRFTGAQIGILGDVDIITLSSADVSINGDLSATGDLAVTGDAAVTGTLGVVGNMGVGTVGSQKFVVTASDGSLAIGSDKFTVTGTSGDTSVLGDLTVASDLAIGPTSMTRKLTVDGSNGNTQTSGTLGVGSDFSVGPSSSRTFTVAATSGDVVAIGKVAVGGSHGDANKELYVNGDVYASGTTHSAGDLQVGSSKFTVDASSGDASAAGDLAVAGVFKVNTDKLVVSSAGDLTIATNKFKVTASSGDTDVAGDLTVTGSAAVSGNFVSSYHVASSLAGATVPVPDGKTVIVITSATASFNVVFDSSATPSAGQLVFVRNKSNHATSDSFSTGTVIAAGEGALYVYTGSNWERVI